MAIRFQCGSCSQPIEVDDEWALKTVACPYCRKTVTAPAASTLEDLNQIPMASPVGPRETPSAWQPAPPCLETAVVQQGNRLASIALVLACCSIAFLVSANFVLTPHRLELEELEKSMTEAESFAGKMQAQTKFFEANPGAMGWLITASVLALASLLASIVGLVCGLIAIRRPQRRGLAAAGLGLAALVPIFLCCGGMLVGLIA